VWHQSRDITSCAFDYSTERARSWLDCGERRGQGRPLQGHSSVLHQTSQSQPLHGVHSQSRDNSLHRIAGLSSLALRVLVEQDRKIGKFDSFFISISLASACSYDHQLSVETPSSKGNMYPCCFGPMLLALHARLKGDPNQSLETAGARRLVSHWPLAFSTWLAWHPSVSRSYASPDQTA
jgi:hypothetical protein